MEEMLRFNECLGREEKKKKTEKSTIDKQLLQQKKPRVLDLKHARRSFSTFFTQMCNIRSFFFTTTLNRIIIYEEEY